MLAQFAPPSKEVEPEHNNMGAWSEDTFGNDNACDWIGSFLGEPGLPTVKSAIESVLHAEDYLDSDEACDCLAACEVIARLQGKWGGAMRTAKSSINGWNQIQSVSPMT
jgi:hypothetical protein